MRLQLARLAPSAVPYPALPTISASPNPFNPAVTITWDLATAQPLDLQIFDVSGRLVEILREGPAPAGTGRATWRGRDDAGREQAGGVYFCRARTGGHDRILKLTLLK